MSTNEFDSSEYKDQEEQTSESSPNAVILDFPGRYDRLMPLLPDINTVMQQVRAAIPISNSIFVKQNRYYHKIKLEDIYLIEGLSDYLDIYTKTKRYIIHSTLHGMVKRLPGIDFIRVHRSYIVRIDSISSIGDNMITVEDRLIPVGKTYKSHLMSRINILA